MANQNGVNF